MPMTSNAVATICGTGMYGGLSFVPDICDLRVSLIAAFSEFTRSTPSLTAEPTIDDSFILNQMVHNEGRIQEWRPAVQYDRQPDCRRRLPAASVRMSRRAMLAPILPRPIMPI